MNIGEAVKERILELCSERDISHERCDLILIKQHHQRSEPYGYQRKNTFF